MDKAVERTLAAIKNNEVITVFGDYDADGVISTTLMIKLFRKINVTANYILPHRELDGYGLRLTGIEKAKQLNTTLLITVDNGITSVEAVKAAKEAGIDVVILDHHTQEGELPEATAIVNPNRQGCTYPFKGLCGAGVVYKFFQAIGKSLFSENDYKNFMLMHLDLVALATIADVVPLRDENYAIVKFGLKSLSQNLRPAMVELKRVSGLTGKDITTTAVGFYLAPRLNVAGRLENADLAVDFLLSETRDQAGKLADNLNALNNRRQKIQEKYINEAYAMVEESDMRDNKVLVVTGKDWNPGLIGIVSGRLKDKYDRPVIAFSRDSKGNYVGSARSTDKFHITNALTEFNQLFITYGGHQKAAGLTVSENNFPEFVQRFTAYANSVMPQEDLKPALMIDSVILPEQLNNSTVNIIRSIGPFGEENPEPVLMLKNARVREMFALSGGKHLKIIVQVGSRDFECVWWRKGELGNIITFDKMYDIAFVPSLNLWNGKENLQLVVEDVRIAESEQ
jgi:single-stranded-DNA-specific exonuclease